MILRWWPAFGSESQQSFVIRITAVTWSSGVHRSLAIQNSSRHLWHQMPLYSNKCRTCQMDVKNEWKKHGTMFAAVAPGFGKATWRARNTAAEANRTKPARTEMECEMRETWKEGKQDLRRCRFSLEASHDVFFRAVSHSFADARSLFLMRPSCQSQLQSVCPLSQRSSAWRVSLC